jgi:AcrR family transcriptional regulator
MTEAHPTRKRLLLAFAKLKRDAGPGAKGPSISAVAKEAGVSNALIHTKYPDIAEQIRDANGKGPKRQLAKHREQLQAAETRSSELRDELADIRKLNRGLASKNATLILKVRSLEERIAILEAGVHPLRPTSS